MSDRHEATLDAPVERSVVPDARSRTLAAVAVGSFWFVPLVGPVVARAFMRGSPFALFWFRYAFVVQGVVVLAFALAGLETLLRGRAEWTSLVVLPVVLWAVYGSIVGLVAVLDGRRRALRPIPRHLLWAPGERPGV